MQRAFLLTALVVGLGHAAYAAEHSAIAPESKGTFRGRPTVAAMRVGQAPDIDGHLDDDAWRLAKPAGELSAEEQMAQYEESLKETDWGHQPC